LVNMKRNINDEEITKKTDDEGNGVDEQLYPVMHKNMFLIFDFLFKLFKHDFIL
jgi:hypothetical protein